MKSSEIQAMASASGETESQEPPSAVDSTPDEVPVKPEWDFPVNKKTLQFMRKYFPSASRKEWNDWHWQIRNSFKSLPELNSILSLSEEEKVLNDREIKMPVRITPYYASLLDPENANQPLRRTVVPVIDERIRSAGEESDPLGEGHDSPVDHIVHRYPDRVLFLITGFCSVYCRYCTRSHMVAKKDKCHQSMAEWDKAIEYISRHNEIRDVLLSGGDPLTLSEHRLEYLLDRLRQIEHVEIIRIGTKVPVVLPQRITPELVAMLRKYHPLYISIHFTHPEELTPETQTACNRLADAGIPMGSQTVLLKGINDNPAVFKKLTHELLKVRVRPYYLYQCDPIPGSSHFRTSVEAGLEVIRNLRGHTSGYAIPHYVIDAPGGGGKIPLLPKYVEGRQEGNLILRNYEDKIFTYPDYM